MVVDCRQIAVSTDSIEAAGYLDQAVADYMDYRMSASAAIKSAIEIDPNFILAHCFRGYLLLMVEVKALVPKVRQIVDDVTPCLSTVSVREQLHVAALGAWSDGDLLLACRYWEQIVTEHPLDLFALKLHHTISFYVGRSNVMRSVLGGALGAWNENIEGYGCVQGMYAYALEECGNYEQAERWGRAAVERNPGDLWAIHSVAHVLEMQGRSAEGIGWLNYTPEEWVDKNPFKAHVWWHAGLFFIAQGKFEESLGIYDRELCSVNTASHIDVSNQAALLKRLQLLGVDIGERWEVLGEFSRQRINEHMLPFRDAHFCLALAANGDFKTAKSHIRSMTDFSKYDRHMRGQITRDVLIPLCKGIIAYEQGHYDEACEKFYKIQHDLIYIGGSNAQRDLFSQLICDAAVRADSFSLARSLLSERVLNRPTKAGNWQLYSNLLKDLGDSNGASEAQTQSNNAIEFGL